ncbi:MULTISPECIES: BLUF domain-containing protein [unclassified Psychrobacter]|uniref:BLUF domain-containing protein n=1 Tax=unclassified Psychrobacter TaxID=196806 RepID=UPI00188D5E1A|nr:MULTISPECIES: BLUF domain-containing protein [unclassified Psychrobacter]MBF4489035.1 BLUF domain-containing protein [Psychrobacter sp. N25K4-3-2]MBP3945455.1 BLUF domain-containing protein [Psychrobacter sp. K31L]
MDVAELSEKNQSNMLHGEHIITRLTYISRYNKDNPNGEVTRILAQAQQNNEHNGITGALVFNHNYFLQSIEGARPVINELLRKLVKDERHFSLQIIECREIEQRHWNKWSMKYLIPSDENKGLALKFSTSTQFNPYLMSANQIMMLIDTLSELQEQEEKEASAKKKSWFAIS